MSAFNILTAASRPKRKGTVGRPRCSGEDNITKIRNKYVPIRRIVQDNNYN